MIHSAAKKFASSVRFAAKNLLHLRTELPFVSPEGLAFSSSLHFE